MSTRPWLPLRRAPAASDQHTAAVEVREHRVRAGRWCWRVRTATPGRDETLPGVVVLVHGLGMSGRSLVPTLRLLGRERVVLAPDLPGFGGSDRPPHPLRLPELADALAALLDAMGLPRVALLGHSVGCQVVAHLADRHPSRVAALVLVSPSRDPTARYPWQQALRLLRDAPREAPSLLPLAVVDYLRAGPRRMWRTLVDSLTTDARSRLRRLPQPTLVVRGERDPVVSAPWAQTVAALLPRGRLVTLADAPHGVPYSSARPLVETVEPFLAEHGR